MVSEAKLKATKVTGRKILIPKEMLERLPIGLAQVKVDNNYRNVWNKIIQIVYSLYQSEKLLKKYIIR